MGMNDIQAYSRTAAANLRQPAAAGRVRRPVPEAAAEQIPAAAPETALTQDEKVFFEGLFPQAKSEVRNYTFNRNGETVAPVTTGTIIDRKG